MERKKHQELQESNQSDNISNQFSNEIFFKIFSALPVKDVLTCRLVCRNWRDNEATLSILRTRTKPINFRSNIELTYFSWLMRTTPGAQIPFSKFVFHFDKDIAVNKVEDFMTRYGLDVTGLAIHFYIQKTIMYEISKWTMQKQIGYKLISDYRQSVPLLLLNSLKLTTLYLTVPFNFDFPITDDSSYVQAFQYLKKLKVKFALMDSGYSLQNSELPTMFENVIKNSPRLQVLSLLYYPYFCAVENDYLGRPEKYPADEDTMRTDELQNLPTFLSLLRSSSTKVKLRLGVITSTFQNAFNQLSNLNPQPRIIALAISLPLELDRALSASIWTWIQTLPLLKLKFFENYSRYRDIPDLPTNPFYSVHQLRLTRFTQITSNRDHFPFPNLRKLSIEILVSDENQRRSSMSPEFVAFCTLVANVPHLEHLRLKEDAWEVLTVEPFSKRRGGTGEYVLQQIENQRGKPCEIRSPIQQLKKLTTLQVDWRFAGLWGAAYASATGRLQRLNRFIFLTQEKYPGDPSYVKSKAAAILRECHHNVEFPNEYIEDWKI